MPEAISREQLAQNIALIRQRMAQAAARAGRRTEEIALCAASKLHDADTVRLAAGLDIDIFGENHVQELVAKRAAGAYLQKPLHFIGHLQTNKVKQVVGAVQLIESVDSAHLLQAIEKQAARLELVQDILLEVNIGGEESKSGIAPQQLPAEADPAGGLRAGDRLARRPRRAGAVLPVGRQGQNDLIKIASSSFRLYGSAVQPDFFALGDLDFVKN